MIKKINFSLVMLMVASLSFAQKSSEDVLFTVDGDPITSSEFIRVYNKNLDLVKDDSQKDVDNYLGLFVNYQLKIKEAKRIGLDTLPKYQREFENYKKQLSKNYLSDTKVTEALIQEAYERFKEDIKASHILVMLDENERDTLNTYNQLVELRQRVLDEGFEKVKSEVHDGKTIFAENLGYFSSFKMVYPFETAAYSTKVGEISMPFRTRFGYHIVKVEDRRPSRGEVTVAHIMVANKPADTLWDPEVRIKEIYKKLKQGENFESLAKQFSDDKSSSGKGGQLTPFSSGQLSSPEFEDVAFGLSTAGEISKPFQTQFGWHIVKLIDKKDIEPLSEVRAEIENKVKRDARSGLINTALAKKLKQKYSVKDDAKKINYFTSILTTDYYNGAWDQPEGFENNKELFKLGSSSVTYGDFANHLKSIQKIYTGKTTPFNDIINKEYDSFQEQKILKYHEDHLEFENEDFAQILKEYRDGLLLFDLMEKEVWTAATKDTIGLKDYYSTHTANYMWKDRIDATMATAAKKSDIEKVKKLLKKGLSDEAIGKELNSEAEQKVIFTKGVMETDNQSLPKNLELKNGLSKVYQHNDAYHVLTVNDVFKSEPKTYDEAKGKLISDYQNQLEEDWLKSLHQRYKVEINDKALEAVKKQIKN